MLVCVHSLLCCYIRYVGSTCSLFCHVAGTQVWCPLCHARLHRSQAVPTGVVLCWFVVVLGGSCCILSALAAVYSTVKHVSCRTTLLGGHASVHTRQARCDWLPLLLQLVFVKPDFVKYTAASEQTRAVFRLYDPDFEAGSLDEAYLDVTTYCREHATTGEQVRVMPALCGH